MRNSFTAYSLQKKEAKALYCCERHQQQNVLQPANQKLYQLKRMPYSGILSPLHLFLLDRPFQSAAKTAASAVMF